MIFRSFVLLISGIFFLIWDLAETYPQSSQNDMGLFAQVSPSLSLKVEGGVNDLGRATIITGGQIAFGNVTFAEPQLISNGDAYLNNQFRLSIEATLKVTVTSGGINQANVELTRPLDSANPFASILFSNGTRREDATQSVPKTPERVLIRTVQNGGAVFPLRIIGIIEPTQSGTFSETVRIYASATSNI